MAKIFIGTSGYSIADWKGNAYPEKIQDSKMFDWYVNEFGFNMVEINYTYYRQPSIRTFESLDRKSADSFKITVKLFGGLTHDPWKNGIPLGIDEDMCTEFLHGISPIVNSGKLGCILAQFPANVMRCPENWGYMLSLKSCLNNLPLVFEFRNKSWVSQETYGLLKKFDIGFCVVDEPKLGALMPLVPEVTSDIAYLRLHGRSKNWFKNIDLRYDYLYSEKELKSFLPIINSMAAKSSNIYIAFNNCHAGSAVQNVRMLKDLMGLDNGQTSLKLL